MIEGHGDDSYRYKGIKSDFSSNICAHGGHDVLMAHLAAHSELISHYPEPEAWSLEKMIAERLDIDPQCVIVTNGATEAIYLIAQAFAKLRPVIPVPTFSEYMDACRMCGQSFDKTTNKKNDGGNTIAWLCNPNNPIGKALDQLYVDSMMAKHTVVVLDQSYEEYTPKHTMSPRWAVRTPYSIQIHSFTKTYGVPGLRLGYITAHESLTGIIRTFLRPWSVSAFAIEAGKFLLNHDELKCKPDFDEAQRLRDMLLTVDGISVFPTQTNFMLCQIKDGNASELKDFLATEHNILIRDASNFRGLKPSHFRIAAQTPAENDALVNAIREYLRLQFL